MMRGRDYLVFPICVLQMLLAQTSNLLISMFIAYTPIVLANISRVGFLKIYSFKVLTFNLTLYYIYYHCPSLNCFKLVICTILVGYIHTQ
jgi:hypothetical protein